jgi:O-antigen/teichoic acid export membrane protein
LSLLKKVVGLGSANIALLAAQALTVAALGVLLPAEPFGVFLLGLTIAQAFSAFATLRFDSAIPSAGGDREQRSLLILSVGCGMMISLLVVAGTYIMAQLRLFALDQLSLPGILLVGAITFALACAQMGRYWAIRQGNLAIIQRSTFGRAFMIAGLRGTILIWALLLPQQMDLVNLGALLLLAEVAATGTNAFILFPRRTRGDVRYAMSGVTLRAAVRRNWKFPALEMPSAIMNSFALNAPIFLVTQFYGLVATAAFGLAFRAIAVPVGQLALALTEVMQSQYSAYLRSGDTASFRRLFYGSSTRMAMAGAIICPVVYFAAEPVITAVMGEKMRLFAQIAAIITPWVSMNVLVNVNSRIITLLRRQELKLIYDMMAITNIVILFIVNQYFDLELLPFVTILTAMICAAYALYWFIIRHAVLNLSPGHKKLESPQP